MAWEWVVPVVEGVVKIVGSIFSNKSKSDAQKSAANLDVEKWNEQMAAAAKINSDMFASYVKGQSERYIQLGRKLKATALDANAPRLTDAEMAEYKKLKAEDEKNRADVDNRISQSVASQRSIGLPDNPITSPSGPPGQADGGFLSGGGSSWNPFGIEETTITAPKMQAGMSPLLIVGLLAAGGGLIYSQTKGKRSKRRR